MARPTDFSKLQPQWAGEEPSVEVDAKVFFAELMKESPAQQMITRGYAVVSLAPATMRTYDDFYKALALFCNQPLAEKLKFAQLKNGTKMDDSTFTPNQFHGYSQMQGLKEQLMIRAPGVDTDLYLPAVVGENLHFAALAMRLYEQLDQLGRAHLHGVADQLALRRSAVDRVLDPVNVVGAAPHTKDSAELGSRIATDYVHPGFISTSILDVFHYFNNFRSDQADKDDQFHNNHAYAPPIRCA